MNDNQKCLATQMPRFATVNYSVARLHLRHFDNKECVRCIKKRN